MYFLFATVLSLVFAVFASREIFLRTDGGILFVLFFSFTMACTSWAYFVSAFFSRSMTGSIGGSIAYLVGYFMIYLWRPDWGAAEKTALCLLPGSALSMGLAQISIYESNGVGLTTANINDRTGNDSFTFYTMLSMMIW